MLASHQRPLEAFPGGLGGCLAISPHLGCFGGLVGACGCMLVVGATPRLVSCWRSHLFGTIVYGLISLLSYSRAKY